MKYFVLVCQLLNYFVWLAKLNRDLKCRFAQITSHPTQPIHFSAIFELYRVWKIIVQHMDYLICSQQVYYLIDAWRLFL